MAAVKRRDRKFPQSEFEVPLATAVAALLEPADIVAGATWHFHVDGATLIITRIDVVEETPGNGPPAFAAVSRKR